MNNIITIIQVLISLVLIVVIFFQAKGSGLGSAFGDSAYQRTRRGSDKAMFQLTIGLSVAFVAISLANILV